MLKATLDLGLYQEISTCRFEEFFKRKLWLLTGPKELAVLNNDYEVGCGIYEPSWRSEEAGEMTDRDGITWAPTGEEAIVRFEHYRGHSCRALIARPKINISKISRFRNWWHQLWA